MLKIPFWALIFFLELPLYKIMYNPTTVQFNMFQQMSPANKVGYP